MEENKKMQGDNIDEEPVNEKVQEEELEDISGGLIVPPPYRQY